MVPPIGAHVRLQGLDKRLARAERSGWQLIGLHSCATLRDVGKLGVRMDMAGIRRAGRGVHQQRDELVGARREHNDLTCPGLRRLQDGRGPQTGRVGNLQRRLIGLAGISVDHFELMKILSEIGTDLSRFANVKHFCSWLGLCPATKISGGKVLSARTKRCANRVRQALKMAAMSLSHSDSALGAFYRRLCGRMDKPRANTATAHKLARMVYFMLTRGQAFVDQGQQRYEEQQRQRIVAALKRRAAALGFQINPVAATASQQASFNSVS